MQKSLALISLSAIFSGCAQHNSGSDGKEEWNARNNPQAFNVSSYNFDALPTEGMLPDSAFPWSDDYWPTYAGGISKRWQVAPNSTNYKDFQYPFLSQSEVVNGSASVAIKQLSPAEKYDLLLARYDFPLARNEREIQERSVNAISHQVPLWLGICHGWAPATLMEPEPGQVAEMVNPDGIKIPFYTSDINALMSKVYAEYIDTTPRGTSVSVGERCYDEIHEVQRDENGRVIMSNCRDTNPGSLHLVLASWLGADNPEDRRGFVADITRASEVWNQAIVGYKVLEAKVKPFRPDNDPFSEVRAPRTVNLVRVKTELSYVHEMAPHGMPMLAKKEQYTRKLVLDYTLELNARGDIIGGEWNGQNVPDFLWRMLSRPVPGPYLDYETVSGILAESLN
ncbi:MAG: hypothetical protein AB7T49_14075 [Oligoflexales bacterium]